MSEKSIPEDVFILPAGEDKYYLYAPLRRWVLLVNGKAANIINNYLKAPEILLQGEAAATIDTMKKQGLIGKPSPPPPIFPDGYSFRPHRVTLFLTSRCNLRCRYCYAEAGHKSVDMQWEVAKAAIDLTAENAGILGAEQFSVGFHGGGEPTVAWDLLTACVSYSKKKADEMGLDVEIFSATNAVLNQKQAQYIAKNFTTINVSLDGPEDIQNFNRPLSNGGDSYPIIKSALHYLDSVGFYYGIRSTITSETAGRMPEIVESLKKSFKISYIHFEPVWLCGRCLTTGEKRPTDKAFIEGFRAAHQKGLELGIDVFYSGSRLDVLTSKFCAAPGDGFTVLPEGIATSCYEVTETNDPRASLFHFGRYDKDKMKFVFDKNRIEKLQKLSVENLSHCEDCFCKWHCAGDCLAKVFEKNGGVSHDGSERCDINRELTLAMLKDLVDKENVSQM